MKSVKLLILLLVPVLLLSCSKGKDEIYVAEVGDRVITVADIEALYAKVDPKFLDGDTVDERKLNFLNTLIDKEVMAIKADELGYDKDPSVIAGLKAFKRMGLQGAYLKFEVVDKVKITDEILKQYYDNLGKSLTIKQILTDTPEAGEEVSQLLKDGADFESICIKYSKTPDADTGGKAETITFGRFPADLQDEVFNLPVGGISKPIESGFGFFIIKVLKINQAKHPRPFEAMKEELTPTVQALEEKRFMDRRTDKLRKKAGLEWYYDNIRIMFEALPPDRPLTSPPARNDEAYPLLKFGEPDYDKVLVSYLDKTITIRDLSDLYDRQSFFERPRREYRLGGIKRVMVELIMNELVEIEMKESKIEEHPELQKILKAKKEEMMVTRMFEEQVMKEVVVTSEEIRNYYEDNSELYKLPEQRRFGVIVTADATTAQEAYTQLVGGMRHSRAAQLFSIDEQTRSNGGETNMLIQGNQPELDDVGFDLKEIGDISRPFESSKGWVVLKLVEKSPQRVRSLNEVQNAVRKDISTLKNDARLKELIDKWKEKITINTYEDNLKKAEVHERERTKYVL